MGHKEVVDAICEKMRERITIELKLEGKLTLGTDGQANGNQMTIENRAV